MAERKRVGGRFVSSKEPVVEIQRPVAVAQAVRGLRPTQCRTFAQKRMAEALPEIVDRFVREAKQGSIAHAKALVGLSGIDKAEAASSETRRRRTGLTALLLRELKRGAAEAKDQQEPQQ